MKDMTRRDVLGTMAALTAGSLTSTAMAASVIDAEPPPERALVFPGATIPLRVNSQRQLLNLRFVTTYVSLYTNTFLIPVPEGDPRLQLWVTMSTRHRKGFGIPIELVSAVVTMPGLRWQPVLTSNPDWNTSGSLYGSASEGPIPPAAARANLVLTYKVKGRKRTTTFKGIEVFAPFYISR